MLYLILTKEYHAAGAFFSAAGSTACYFFSLAFFQYSSISSFIFLVASFVSFLTSSFPFFDPDLIQYYLICLSI